METTYRELNAQINLYTPEGDLQLDKDAEAARAYFLETVNENTVFFHSLQEKYNFLVNAGLWKELKLYSFDEIKRVFRAAYAKKYRFKTFLGAYKFYHSYALKTADGQRFYERYEDRVSMVALDIADGDAGFALDIVEAIISGRFQPATPTFLNAGRANSGDLVSCYLLRIEDNMESISRAITDSLQLSKRGGGVALLMSNIREAGAPIKQVENQSSGIIPVMKLLEDSFSYANQLGQRQGAGAVYLNAHHPDIMRFLDTKRENADEKTRIKTLSLGVVIPDITFELARRNDDMYLFSPYDVERTYGKPFADISVTELYHEMVENPEIRKSKINARKFFQALAEVQFESGYPYILFEDRANEFNPAKNEGRITQSNLCSEILQPATPSTFRESGEFSEIGSDISCNLGSLNIAKMMECDGFSFAKTISVAHRFLTAVSEKSLIGSSPSVAEGNRASAAIGLGQMNLHGYLIEKGIAYDSDEARRFFHTYMDAVTFWLIQASADMASETSRVYDGFNGSEWGNGNYIDRIINHRIHRMSQEDREAIMPFAPTEEDWIGLMVDICAYGLYNRNLQAIPPTGSISYINNSTASIHPVTSAIEIRKEGKLGRVYYPAYGLTSENVGDVKDAYEIGYEPLIDMYAETVPYVDQSSSLTLFFKDTATTRDINRAQIYAHKKGIKTIYYSRIRQQALTGTAVDECVSCML